MLSSYVQEQLKALTGSKANSEKLNKSIMISILHFIIC